MFNSVFRPTKTRIPFKYLWFKKDLTSLQDDLFLCKEVQCMFAFSTRYAAFNVWCLTFLYVIVEGKVEVEVEVK